MFEKFIGSGDSRETSEEIMDAITNCASSPEEAEKIWADPTPEQVLAIWERVTKNGLNPSSDFCWGGSGSNWASDHGIDD